MKGPADKRFWRQTDQLVRGADDALKVVVWRELNPVVPFRFD